MLRSAEMDRSAPEDQLQRAESQAQCLEANIAFQQQMIAKLELGGHDVRAAGIVPEAP